MKFRMIVFLLFSKCIKVNMLYNDYLSFPRKMSPRNGGSSSRTTLVLSVNSADGATRMCSGTFEANCRSVESSKPPSYPSRNHTIIIGVFLRNLMSDSVTACSRQRGLCRPLTQPDSGSRIKYDAPSVSVTHLRLILF